MPDDEELAKDIEQLKFRISQLMELVDPERNAFVFHCMGANLSEHQVKAIYDLMDETRKGIKESKPIHHAEFERRVYEIVPSKNGDYHFAEGIVSTLYDKRRYEEVFKHMQKSGMNIHDDRDEKA